MIPENGAANFSLRAKVVPELFLQPQMDQRGVVNEKSPLQAEPEIVNDSI